MNITVFGATDHVTGSKTFIEFPDGLLMVDCGLVQGPLNADELNRSKLPFAASDIKAIIITHAHLDHSGQLPYLVKKGFQGNIYCTPATAKLMQVILMDSAGLVGEDYYSEQDVSVTLSMLKTIEWEETASVLGGSVKLRPAGHILGASSVYLSSQGKKIVLSGDLGRKDDPLIPPPRECLESNIVLMESTYGDRNREGDYRKELHSFLTTVSRESRIGIIASFAVARAQMLLTLIFEFYQRHPEEKVRVVLDSPMMKEACKIYKTFSHLTLHQHELFEAMSDLEIIEHQREWESLSRKSGPLIILSSSGMLTGGRIRRHLENWQNDPKAILFLPGYQGEGTPGRSMMEGQRQINFDSETTINWQGEVWGSDAFSSHADQAELLNWVANISKDTPLYLIHGEEESKQKLKQKLRELGHSTVMIPKKGDIINV